MNISNQSNVIYYAVELSKLGVHGSLKSNTVNTETLYDEITKVISTDKAFAKEGETSTYTVIFKNEGNININDIYFTDSTPQGTTFVEKSVTINDQNISAYRPDIGYGVASLPPYDSAITSFQTTRD